MKNQLQLLVPQLCCLVAPLVGGKTPNLGGQQGVGQGLARGTINRIPRSLITRWTPSRTFKVLVELLII